jgi:hypothetical protein
MFIPNGIIGDVSIGIKIEDTDLFPKRKPDQVLRFGRDFCHWRRKRESNPCARLRAYELSKPAPSATWVFLHVVSCGNGNYKRVERHFSMMAYGIIPSL